MHLTKQELRALIKRNPDLKMPPELDEPVTAHPSAGSALEERFLVLWRSLDGPDLVREYRFDPTRRYRLDFYYAPSDTGIELEGGTWQYGKSRHSSPQGFRNDAEKYLLATLQGITVFRLTSDMVTPEWVDRILTFIRSKDHAD